MLLSNDDKDKDNLIPNSSLMSNYFKDQNTKLENKLKQIKEDFAEQINKRKEQKKNYIQKKRSDQE